MGNCSYSQSKRKERDSNWESSTTAMVIGLDGRLQELRKPIKANYILSQNPNCYLCSSEDMYVGCHAPPVPENEELQLGQIYFSMPISTSRTLLSLQDLCGLAIKAHTALANPDVRRQPTAFKTSAPFSDINGVGFLAGPRDCCKPVQTS